MPASRQVPILRIPAMSASPISAADGRQTLLRGTQADCLPSLLRRRTAEVSPISAAVAEEATPAAVGSGSGWGRHCHSVAVAVGVCRQVASRQPTTSRVQRGYGSYLMIGQRVGGSGRTAASGRSSSSSSSKEAATAAFLVPKRIISFFSTKKNMLSLCIFNGKQSLLEVYRAKKINKWGEIPLSRSPPLDPCPGAPPHRGDPCRGAPPGTPDPEPPRDPCPRGWG